MPRIHAGLPLQADQAAALIRLSKARSTPQHYAIKAESLLRLAAGQTIKSIAADLGTSRVSVMAWREAFLVGGAGEGLPL